jgi:mannose-1-phosphate guanylyltransferase
MVMVFKARTLVDLVRGVAPQMYRFFGPIWEAIGTTGEADAVNDAYRHMEAVNFSRGLLEALPSEHASRLLVLPVRGVVWSDWGSEERVLSVLGTAGYQERRHEVTENDSCQVSEKKLYYSCGKSLP